MSFINDESKILVQVHHVTNSEISNKNIPKLIKMTYLKGIVRSPLLVKNT